MSLPASPSAIRRAALIAVVIGAFAGGWLLGQRGREESQREDPVVPAPARANAEPSPARPTPSGAPPEHGAAEQGAVAPASAVFKSLLKLQARQERESALEAMGRSLAGTNLAEALRLAGTIEDRQDRESFLSGVVRAWAAVDPAAALAFCLEQNFSARCQLVPIVFAEHARSHPEKAIRVLDGLPRGEILDKATEALFTTWSATHPADAARHVGTIKEGTLRERILESFAGEWSANNPPAALAWALKLERAEDQAIAVSSALREFGRRHPLAALEWAGQNRQDARPLAGDSLAGLLAEAGFVAPKEAFQQGLTFGNDPDVKEALAAVASYFAEDQPAGLLQEYLRLNPAQQEQNSGAVLFALGSTAFNVPQDALASLASPEAQQAAVNAYIQGLKFHDANAAEAWVRSLPVGPIRAAAQRSLEQPGGSPAGRNTEASLPR